MSQNKTVIQGLEVDNKPQQAPQQGPNATGFYARGNSAPHNGTVVSGMMENPTPTPNPVAAPSAPASKNVVPGKPVVGFLYSVSRTMVGEFWPLYLGKNTIGNDGSSIITLAEGTVSREHATLRVLRDKFSGKISAWLIDTMSTNGTYVNNVMVGATPVDCKNGDIITIGDNYQLYLVLIDASALNLKVSEEFVPIQTATPTYFEEPQPIVEGTQSESFNPWGGSDYTPTPGTVGLDGSSEPSHGGTKPL